jgi:hypothetical protein
LQFPDSIAYMDCDIEDGIGPDGKVHEHPYDCGPWSYSDTIGIRKDAAYQDTIIFAKQWWEAVGGYPTDQPDGIWEDWLFGVKLHIAGIGATYVRGKKWGRYRHWTAGELGSKNARDNTGHKSDNEEEAEAFRQKVFAVRDWIKRKEQMMPCRGCGKRNSRTLSQNMATAPVPLDGEITLIYEGDREGGFSLNSKVYRGRKIRIEKGVPFLLNRGDAWVADADGFREIKEEEAVVPSFPKEAPPVPEIKLDQPQQYPQVSRPQIPDIPPLVRPPGEVVQVEVKVDKMNGLVELEFIGKRRLAKIRDAGFDTMDKIKEDFVENDGNSILAVEGIGRSTWRKIRNAVT